MKAVIILIILSQSAWADFLRWRPHPDTPALLLPLGEEKDPHRALERYLRATLENHQLRWLRKLHPQALEGADVKSVEIVPASIIARGRRPQLLFLANTYRAWSPHAQGMKHFLRLIENFGGDAHVLPPSADAGLNKASARIFRERVAATFDALMALGGHDIHPKFYRQEITHARRANLNPARDGSEIRLLKTFIKKARGVFYGICRGAQLCAAALGAELIQDLKAAGNTESEVHNSGNHPVSIRPGSLLAELVGKESMIVRSYHHQAVAAGNENVLISASHGEGKNFVIEAWELPNRLGLGVQFHPEHLSDEPDNRNLIENMVRYAGKIKNERDCFKLLSAPKNASQLEIAN